MAKTQFTTAHALRITKWSAIMFKYGLSNTFFGKFLGKFQRQAETENTGGKGVNISTDPNAIVQLRMELAKGKGDKITFPMRAPLVSEGVVGDEDLEGTEEAMSFYDYSVELKEIAHAVRTKGRLSDKRVAFDVKQQAVIGLSEWMGRKIDGYTREAMSGIASVDGNVAANPPISLRSKWVGGETEAGVLSHCTNDLDAELTVAATYLFGPKTIQAVRRRAQMAVPKVRPIRISGKDYYVMFIHPFQAKALKATDQWNEIQKMAGVRGEKNPIFTGALGMWDGVILHEWERLHTRLGASGTGATELFDTGDTVGNGVNAARALLCGAQAVVHAFGALPRPLSKMFDYGRKWAVGVDCQLAVSKTEFDSKDYGVIAVDTAIEPD